MNPVVRSNTVDDWLAVLPPRLDQGPFRFPFSTKAVHSQFNEQTSWEPVCFSMAGDRFGATALCCSLSVLKDQVHDIIIRISPWTAIVSPNKVLFLVHKVFPQLCKRLYCHIHGFFHRFFRNCALHSLVLFIVPEKKTSALSRFFWAERIN